MLLDESSNMSAAELAAMRAELEAYKAALQAAQEEAAAATADAAEARAQGEALSSVMQVCSLPHFHACHHPLAHAVSSCMLCPDHDLCAPCTQAQAQREALRHQTSKKLLQAGRPSDGSGAAEQGSEELMPEDYADIAALAGRLSAQQEEIQQLSSRLSSANAKRAELAKVCVPAAPVLSFSLTCCCCCCACWPLELLRALQ